MTITIRQYGNRYDVITGDNRLHVLNAKSLVYHLKRVLKLNYKQVDAISEAFTKSNEVVIELTQVKAS